MARKAPNRPGPAASGAVASIAAALDWPCLVARGESCLLDLSVVPNARHTGVDGLHDGALRIFVALES